MAKPPVKGEEPLYAELKSFLDAVRRRVQPVVSLEDGRRALALALEIVEQIEKHGKRIDLEKLVQG
jgi:predicted dehydrogenase